MPRILIFSLSKGLLSLDISKTLLVHCKDILKFRTLYKIYFCPSSKSFHLFPLLINPPPPAVQSLFNLFKSMISLNMVACHDLTTLFINSTFTIYLLSNYSKYENPRQKNSRLMVCGIFLYYSILK